MLLGQSRIRTILNPDVVHFDTASTSEFVDRVGSAKTLVTYTPSYSSWPNVADLSKMAPRQRTFELVPNPPPGLQGLAQPLPAHQENQVFSKPPMTTKQAKKLHRQANKGPKLSKAEQRRIELMEQDRIRKEFEKERQQARARTARDRKKAKEEKAKEERRRKGLPMVDVHPSQDVISRFIKRDAPREDSLATTSRPAILREEHTDTTTAAESGNETRDEANDDEDDDRGNTGGDEKDNVLDKENQEPAVVLEDERPAKRLRLSPREDEETAICSPAPHGQTIRSIAQRAQELQAQSHSRASSIDVDDPVNATLLENQLIEDVILASSRKLAKSSPLDRSSPRDNVLDLPPAHAPGSSGCKDITASNVKQKKPTQPQQEHTSMRTTSCSQRASTEAKPQLQSGEDSFKKPAPPHAPVRGCGPAIGPLGLNAQLSRPKFKTPMARQHHPQERPKFLPRHVRVSQQGRHTPVHQRAAQFHSHSAPTSTQQYLLNYVDDIFPSPSQEAAELSDFHVRLVGASGPATTREQNALKKSKENVRNLTPQQPVSTTITRREPPSALLPSVTDMLLDFPMSTQELVMSSQDIRDIETPTKTATPPVFQMQHGNEGHRTLSAKGLNDRDCAATRIHHPVLKSSNYSQETGSIPIPERFKVRSIGSRTPRDEFARRSQASAGLACCQPAAQPANAAPEYEATKPGIREKPPSIILKDEGSGPQQALQIQCSSVRHSRSTTVLSNNKAAPVTQASRVPSEPSPPKKRMFGSSGLGADVLVAMERSYQDSRRKERDRAQALKTEEALQNAVDQNKQQDQLGSQLMDLVEDDFLDDDLTPFSGVVEPPRLPSYVPSRASPSIKPSQQGGIARNSEVLVASGRAGGGGLHMASQETDYGGSELDADKEMLDLLEADTTWLDDDLDDCI